MTSPAKCPQCGHRFIVAEPVTRVPFTLDALTRIKNGATARELGWDEPFYLSVCRKHGLEPTVYAPKTQAAPEIEASPPLAVESVVEVAPVSVPATPPAGPCIYSITSRELVRGEWRVQLPPRQADVFVFLAKASAEKPANGRNIAERLGIDARGGVGGHVIAIRAKILPLHLRVIATKGRVAHGAAGYWLGDLDGEPVAMTVQR